MKVDLDRLTPRQIVQELDKYIVGQDKAKKAVAIALRNRTRRQRLSEDMRDEVAPKNIIMIGPTGVGKTEIARRLARLVGAPFLKVEATKYTEVGYVGRDVESMIRDLVQVGVSMVKGEMQEEVRQEAERRAEEAMLDLLLPGVKAADSGLRAADSGLRPVAEAGAKPAPESGGGGRPLHAREVPRQAAPRRAGGPRRGGQRDPQPDAGHRDLLRRLPGGAGRQPGEPRKPGQHFRGAQEAQEDHRGPGPGDPAGRGDGQAGGHGPGDRAGHPAGGADGDRLRGRDRQDRLPAERLRHRRLPRGGPARHPAHRRGQQGEHPLRDRGHRPHPVHRGGGLPHEQALGPDPGAAGALPAARRAHPPVQRGLREDPHPAAQRPDQAVRGAAAHRGGRAGFPGGGHPPPGGTGHGGQRAFGEHRRAAPAHHHGAAAGGGFLQRLGARRADDHGHRGGTWRRSSRGSWRTRT